MSMSPKAVLQAASIPFRQQNGKNGTEFVLASCPSCRRGWKCYVNATTGAWHCWHAECQAKGSVHDLAARLGVQNVGQVAEVGGKSRAQPIVWNWQASNARLLADAEIMAYLTSRGLGDSALLTRLRIGVNTIGGKKAVALPHFIGNRVVGVKCRMVGDVAHEDRYRSITGSQWSVFNHDTLANQKWAVLAEGELNAMAWEAAGVPAVSLGSASRTVPTPEEILAFERLDYVVLNYDQDAAGKAAEAELCRRIGPERVRILAFDPEHDAKDANEMLVKHGPEALKSSLANARRCEVPGVMSVTGALRQLVAQEVEREKREAEGGALRMPWHGLAKLVTLEPGRLIVMVGHPKTGKTTAALQIAVENANARIPTLFWCLEMPPTEVVRKIVAQHFLRPMTQVHPEHYEHFLDHWEARPLFLGYGSLRTPEEAYSTLKTAVRVYGARVLVFDNLHFLVRTVENQHNVLANAMKYLKELTTETGVCLVLIAQPSMQTTGKQLGLYAARGSAAIASDCDVMIAMEREGEEGRNVGEAIAEARLNSGVVASEVPTLAHVVANRYGPPGHVVLRYIAGQERFEE